MQRCFNDMHGVSFDASLGECHNAYRYIQEFIYDLMQFKGLDCCLEI